MDNDELKDLFASVITGVMRQIGFSEAGLSDFDPRVKELREQIDLSLEAMITLEKAKEVFDPQAYSSAVLKAMKEASDPDISLAVFYEYCEFQAMVWTLHGSRGIFECFRSAGLHSWLELEMDQQTLLPVAIKIVEGLQEEVEGTGGLPPGFEKETAEFLERIVEIFDIALPFNLQSLVDYYTADDCEDNDDSDDPDQNTPRMLN